MIGRRNAEPGDDPSHLVAARVHRAVELRRDVGDPLCVDERGDRSAARSDRTLDDEIALGEEHAGAGIVTFVGSARQPSLVESELSESRIVRIIDADHGGCHQKWYGVSDQSAGRFSRKLSRPSCASSVP